MIEITADLITERIIAEVDNSIGYFIQFDETTDKSGSSQICFVIRYFNGAEIKKAFIGFVDACKSAEKLESTKISASILAKIIVDFLAEKKIPLKRCIGICTDTCNLMTGINNGVFVELKKYNKNLIHALCLNHITNLSLFEALNGHGSIFSGIKLLKELSSFFSSAKRQNELQGAS